MVREQIGRDLKKACQKVRLKFDKIVVDYPPDPAFGDYTTNLTLQQQKQAKGLSWQTPVVTAKKIVEAFGKPEYLEKIEVVKPGFINFFLSTAFLQKILSEILEQGEKFGQIRLGKGKKARVEFVSANPTGPLHIGNARGGPVGDTIAAVLQAAGFKVLREYFHNNIGSQVDKFGQALFNLQKGERLEEQEYKGAYLTEILKKIGKSNHPQQASQKAVELMLDEILQDCQDLGIKFDKVYYESEFAKNQTDKVLKKLEKVGVLKEYQGAIWFAPTDEYLKDREAVIIKSNGEKTYFANDIAYHDLKFRQGYDLVVDELGAGHDGHIPKLKSAIKALGFNLEKFKVVVHQNVRVKKGGKIITMSKRAGNVITAREVLDEVGRDAFRFHILMHDVSTHMDFDLELASKKASENPVYYVQYAHARICSIIKKAGKRLEGKGERATLHLLNHPAELTLIKNLIKLPEIVEDIADNFQVHRLTSYATETATLFHKFYEQCRVISQDSNLTSARLALAQASKIVLQNTLKLIGVSAPERM